MKWVPVVAVAWVVTLAGVFLLGRQTSPEPPPPAGGDESSKIAELERENEALRMRVSEAEAQAETARRIEAPEGGRDESSPSGRSREAAAASPSKEPVPLQEDGFPSLEGVGDAHALSERLMAFVDQQLAKGPQGYRVLLKALGQIEEHGKELERMFGGDEAAIGQVVYPWVRFLVEREDRVLDLSEYVFKTMAEEPSLYEGMDKDPLEVFTEGVALILPGAVPPDRLARFRGYAEKILETPEESQPEAIKRNRNDIERALERYWSAPITPEQALEKLQAGTLDSAQAMRLLRSMKPEQLREVDVTGLLLPLVRTGNYEAVRAMSTLGDAVPVDVPRLDTAVLQGLEEGSVHSWFIGQYLNATKRQEWSAARTFFDTAFGGTEKARAQAAMALAQLPPNMRPDKGYVEQILQSTELPEGTEKYLKQRFKIE